MRVDLARLRTAGVDATDTGARLRQLDAETPLTSAAGATSGGDLAVALAEIRAQVSDRLNAAATAVASWGEAADASARSYTETDTHASDQVGRPGRPAWR
ncbi:hypothetical protein [Cellulomonas sp. KRMCY2]|uniref:hypothetical protein n=1 Tax=Cellulomonas sp. KRMCY2 TaxID=1304865 RepID=UPI00045E78FF|nr:hypothetical protein [Cellulomonas sp. KRMCY2]